MKNLKHTKEYAEGLALRKAPVQGEQWYIDGYMTAIEETSAPDLLEACIIALKYFNGIDTEAQSEAAFHALNNAINKANKL